MKIHFSMMDKIKKFSNVTLELLTKYDEMKE